MKPDPVLSSLLGDWNPGVRADPGFESRVWSRLAEFESRCHPVSGWIGRLAGWVDLFARPRIALTASVIALTSGILIGGLQARSSGEEAYLRSLDPLNLHLHSR